jgi:hypothetical protein
MEAMSGNTAYNGGLHNWLSQTSEINTDGLAGGAFAVPAGTNFAQPHTYGFLSVPPTADTQGFAQWFFDGQPVGNRVNITADGPFSTLGTESNKLMLGTGTANPMTVYRVQVLQAPATAGEGRCVSR